MLRLPFLSIRDCHELLGGAVTPRNSAGRGSLSRLSGIWRLNSRTTDAASSREVASVIPSDELNPIPTQPARTSAHGHYELKFLIDDDRAIDIMNWARTHLNPDAHAIAGSDGYHVSSVYLDTPELHVYHRRGHFRQRKYRLRRYESESTIWCELKRKQQGIVNKRRSTAGDHELEQKLSSAIPNDNWDGDWFRQLKADRDLIPVLQITYQRFARTLSTDHGTLRLTIDNNLTASPSNGWQVPDQSLSGIALLPGQRVLELKFPSVMPVLFRQLIQDQQLQTTSFSKYRTGVEECLPLDCVAGALPWPSPPTFV